MRVTSDTQTLDLVECGTGTINSMSEPLQTDHESMLLHSWSYIASC